MPRRRLTLNRETLTVLAPADLRSVAGAGISLPHPLCAVMQTGSVEYSQCPSCGIHCEWPTDRCE